MKRALFIALTFLSAAAAFMPVSCNKETGAQNPEAARVISFVNKEMFKNPERVLSRLDSAERAGVFSPSEANILRVNVYWNSGQKRLAAFYGEQALSDAGLKREGEAYYSAVNLMAKWYSGNAGQVA